MKNKELNLKKVVMAFFFGAQNLILKNDKEFIEEEIIKEYHENLEKLEKISGYNLDFSKMQDKDLFKDENSYILGFLPNSNGTPISSEVIPIKKYRKDRFLLN